MKKNILILYLSILGIQQYLCQSLNNIDTIYNTLHSTIITPIKLKDCDDFIIQDKWLITYNKQASSLVIFNLDKNQITNTISLNKFDFLNHQSFHSLSIGQENKFWLLFEDYLIKIDTEGKLYVTINLNTWYNNGLYPLIQKETPIIDKDEIIYLNVYPHTLPFNDSKFYTSPLIYEYNISTQTLTPTKISYPDNYINNYYGFHIFPLISNFYDNALIIGFESSNMASIYNLYNKNISKKTIPNLYYKEKESLPRDYIDSSKIKLLHYINGSNYEKILYDDKSGSAYFVYKINTKNNSYIKDYTNENSAYMLVVTDKNLNLKKNLFIPNGFGIFKYSFITNQKLYVQTLKDHCQYLCIEKIELKEESLKCNDLQIIHINNAITTQAKNYPISFRIYDINKGNMYQSGTINNEKESINLSSLPSAFYCIEISNGICNKFYKLSITN